MPIDWASVFFTAATRVVAGKLTEKSIDGLWALTHSLAGGAEEGSESARALLAPEKTSHKVLAQLRLANRRGALFLGPSGAGKSELIEKLTGKRLPSGPTSGHKRVFTRLRTQVVAMRDTVGDASQWNEFLTTAQNVGSRPDVFVLVFAYGYLDTQGQDKYCRPSKADAYRTHVGYMRGCRKEEKNWLASLVKGIKRLPTNRRAKAIVVVVNKADQWFGSRSVRQRYHGPESLIGGLVEEFKSKCVRAARETYYVETCAQHSRFRHHDAPRGRPPSNHLTGLDAELSVRALRAGIEYLVSNA